MVKYTQKRIISVWRMFNLMPKERCGFKLQCQHIKISLIEVYIRECFFCRCNMYMNSIISNPWWRPPLHFPEMMKFAVGRTRERSVPPRSEVMQRLWFHPPLTKILIQVRYKLLEASGKQNEELRQVVLVSPPTSITTC